MGGFGAHHSQSFEAWFVHVPGLKVVMPANPADAAGLLKAAIRDDNPVLFIEHRGLYGVRGEAPDGDAVVPIGVAATRRLGRDVTVAALGRLVGDALEAADALNTQGISVEVIDLRSLCPLDLDSLAGSVRKTSRLVIAHEAVEFGGVGAEVAARIQEAVLDYLDSPILRVGAPFAPVPYGERLEKAFVPGPPQIVDAVLRVIRGLR
jgi:pyruvate dehydrogenase E1 component beta subunit